MNIDSMEDEMRLKNYTDIDDDLIREIVRFVKPHDVSKFDLSIKNCKYSGRGRAYTNGCSYHDTADPLVIVSIGSADKFPVIWRDRGGGYLPMEFYNRTEALVAITAHEFGTCGRQSTREAGEFGALAVNSASETQMLMHYICCANGDEEKAQEDEMSALEAAKEICKYLGSGDKLITSDLLQSKVEISEIIVHHMQDNSELRAHNLALYRELADATGYAATDNNALLAGFDPHEAIRQLQERIAELDARVARLTTDTCDDGLAAINRLIASCERGDGIDQHCAPDLSIARDEIVKQAAKLEQAHELLTTLDWNDWSDKVDEWLEAYEAQKERKQ